MCVDRVVAVGRRVSDRADPLGIEAREALAGCSGLSPQGVDLALSDHLEVDPSPADLDALLASMDPAPRCHVVLSAHVCVAALRAVACAVATAPEVFVRPSRRDPVLASILTRALSDDAGFAAAGGAVTQVEALAPLPGDALDVYGADATIDAIAASLPPGVRLRGHGTGLGLAAVAASDDLDAAAEALARDVIPFDQRGCLSPRAALVEGAPARAEAFASALHRALGALSARVPRGPLDPETAAEVTRYRTTMEAVGACEAGRDHLVGLDLAPRALLLPPAARVVHVVPATAETGPALLAPWAARVTSLGGLDGPLTRALHAVAPFARRGPLGAMQRPPLDGPVDRRPARAAHP